MLALLVLHAAAPALGVLLSIDDRAVVVLWTLAGLMLAGLAMMNASYTGMRFVCIGLILNALVVILNAGMPVRIESSHGRDEAVVALAQSPLHREMTTDTRLQFLGDLILLPGPSWNSAVVSVGDISLLLGAGWVVVQAMRSHRDGGNAGDSVESRR